MAARMVKVYFNPFARCGNAFFVSLYRLKHCRARHIPGNVVKKPCSLELLELHCEGLFQRFAYKQKNSSTFCPHIRSGWRCSNSIDVRPCCKSTNKTCRRGRNHETRRGRSQHLIDATSLVSCGWHFKFILLTNDTTIHLRLWWYRIGAGKKMTIVVRPINITGQ